MKSAAPKFWQLGSAETKFSGYDIDHDVRASQAKTGGHTWAGGWINPSAPLGGYKEHPTLSVQESNLKQLNFQSAAIAWKRRDKKRMEEEEDDF